jgi:hypothetical protein
VALGFTVTEISTKKERFCAVKCVWHVRVTTSWPSVSQFCKKYGILNISQSYRPPQLATSISFYVFLKYEVRYPAVTVMGNLLL